MVVDVVEELSVNFLCYFGGWVGCFIGFYIFEFFGVVNDMYYFFVIVWVLY